MRSRGWFRILVFVGSALGVGCGATSSTQHGGVESASTGFVSNTSVGGDGAATTMSEGSSDGSVGGSEGEGGAGGGLGGTGEGVAGSFDVASNTSASGGAGTGGVANAAGGSAGTTGTAGGAGESAGGEWPVRPTCGDSATAKDWCEGLEQVVVSVTLVDATGNDGLSPGESAVATIVLQNDSKLSVNYPCAGLMFDHSGVTVTSTSNPAVGFFAISAGDSVSYSMSFSVADDIPIGTTVRGLAWTDVLNTGCDNGGELEFTFTLQ